MTNNPLIRSRSCYCFNK